MDLFDIIGPVMVGPSSSHTAGAARIGKITRMLLGSRPVSARIACMAPFKRPTWATVPIRPSSAACWA